MEGILTARTFAFAGAVLGAIALGLGYWLYGLGGLEAQAQEDCREVLVFGPETESQITSPFEITGNSFRISGEAMSPDPDRPPRFNIQPIDEEGNPAGIGVSIEEAGPFTENILEGPGTFTLEIQTINPVEYSFTVEDCGSTPAAPPGDSKGGTTTPSPSPPPPTPSPPPAPRPAPPPQPTLTPPPADSGTLFKAGGSDAGPMPVMKGGSCPKEFPERLGKACTA